MINTPTIYLAGAIRDDHPEDIEWRESFISSLDKMACILNPLGNKSYHSPTKQWRVADITTTSQHIVMQDLWCVDRADIVIANLLPMVEGYASIGTMMELGRASSQKAIIYAVLDDQYDSSPNPGVFKVHPFLEQIIAQSFPTLDEMLRFLVRHIPMLSGESPRFEREEVGSVHYYNPKDLKQMIEAVSGDSGGKNNATL